MDCVNHSGVTATAFCQNCGKPLCGNCVRNGAGGQILCEPCWMAWQNIPNPFVAPPTGEPNPSAAAVLGLIPGVGAMYNGQFFKGLIHVVIFAVLISITTHYGIFGIFIGAWVLYQSFEAFHTAKARRDGQPLPDPLGLNEVGNWLNLGAKPNYPPPPGVSGGSPGNPNPGRNESGAGGGDTRPRINPLSGPVPRAIPGSVPEPLPGSALPARARLYGAGNGSRSASDTPSAPAGHVAAQGTYRRHRPDRTRTAVSARAAG